jgi:TRAP-type mannitol/chloroaromatic compound transport system substrate-binding protein
MGAEETAAPARRGFLTQAAFGAARAATLAGCGPGSSESGSGAAEVPATRLDELTGGSFQIRAYSAGA